MLTKLSRDAQLVSDVFDQVAKGNGARFGEACHDDVVWRTIGLEVSVGTQESPEICEYPDSGKFRAEPIDGRMKNFDVIRAMGESVGYWEGEP